MPVKVSKSGKITGASIGELSAIIQENTENITVDKPKASALDRIKSRRTLKDVKEDAPEEVGEVKTAADMKPEKEKKSGKKSSSTKKKAEAAEDKPESKKSTATKKKASEAVKEVIASKKSSSTKKKAEAAEDKQEGKKSTATKKKASEAVKEVIASKKSASTKKKAEAAEDKQEGKKSTATKKKASEAVKDKAHSDITLGELLEQAKEETDEGKGGVQRLKNISETIRADSSKRRKRKKDAALVMATITGTPSSSAYDEEEKTQVLSAFPMDVSGIDFEKERFEAEQECIEDFRFIVDNLEADYENRKKDASARKDEIIEALLECDREAQLQMKELKMKQNDLVNRIAEIQEVILIKRAEMESLGFTGFYKRGRIKQTIADNEAEISGLEMEALSYNSKLIGIVDHAAAQREELFGKLETVRNQFSDAQKKLSDAKVILQEMESRERLDETAVQKKLILKALRLYSKPITIGQLLYYPGLSGYSVQRMSAAINQLVVDKQVLKVALEDNVYYLIADKEEG